MRQCCGQHMWVGSAESNSGCMRPSQGTKLLGDDLLGRMESNLSLFQQFCGTTIFSVPVHPLLRKVARMLLSLAPSMRHAVWYETALAWHNNTHLRGFRLLFL